MRDIIYQYHFLFKAESLTKLTSLIVAVVCSYVQPVQSESE